MISLIAAIGKNNEIGKGNALVFQMPADMKYFRDTTRGHTVIMGRNTFESIGKPLPSRRNIVISRNASFKPSGVDMAHSLAGALDLIKDKDEEVFIIGGAWLYAETMPIADKLYITHIDGSVKGADAFFPEIIPIAWNEIKHEEHKKDSENPFNYTFSIYEKFI